MNATARVSSQVSPELKQQTDALLQQTQKQATAMITSTWEAFQSCGNRFIDLGLGIKTIKQLSQDLSPPPHGVSTSTLFAGAYLFDLTRIWTLVIKEVKHLQQLVLDPSIASLTKAAVSTGKIVKTSTRIAYLACALNALNFNPLLHHVNIIATGAGGGFFLVANVSDYLHNLSIKSLATEIEDNKLKEDATKAMVSNLLKIAEGIATIAFALFSATTSPWSMIPLTTTIAALKATAAAFGILAILNDQLSGHAKDYPQRLEKLIAQRKQETARQSERQNANLFSRLGMNIAQAIKGNQHEEPSENSSSSGWTLSSSSLSSGGLSKMSSSTKSTPKTTALDVLSDTAADELAGFMRAPDDDLGSLRASPLSSASSYDMT